MLHPTPGHQPSSSGDEDFSKCLYHNMGMAPILAMWPGPFEHFPLCRQRQRSKLNLNSVVTDEMLESVDRYGRQDTLVYY